MKLASLCMATVLAFGGSALAQSSTPAPSEPAAPATSAAPAAEPAAPEPATQATPNASPAQAAPSGGELSPGANSFTEAQARSWLEDAGYTDVSSLVQSKDGIWRGKAKHNGTVVSVGVDYKGNISAG